MSPFCQEAWLRTPKSPLDPRDGITGSPCCLLSPLLGGPLCQEGSPWNLPFAVYNTTMETDGVRAAVSQTREHWREVGPRQPGLSPVSVKLFSFSRLLFTHL